MRDAEDLIEEAKHLIIEALSNGHRDTANSLIHDTLAEFLHQRTRRHPMIFPVVLEV
jgi:mRNA degradation ribonuclease J1/J2